MDIVPNRQSDAKEPLILGADTATQQPVCLSDSSRQFSLYTIGTPGVGKSALLESIALQDMKRGKGLGFLDPHGDSAQRLLLLVPEERRDDVICWNPKALHQPITLNPFYCSNLDDPLAVDLTVEDFISALSSLQEFTEVFKSAPQMLDILRHMAFACVLKQGTTLLDTVEFLTNSSFRHTFYSALYHHNRRDILKYWQDFDEKTPTRKEQMTSSSLNKLYRLVTTSVTRAIFQDYKPNIDFRTVMDEGKILLVDLSHLGTGNGELIGAFIVFGILRAAFSRGNIPEEERRPFHLFADEFERFMSTAFPQIIDEGRKFNLYCVLAHQHRGQLEGESLGSTLIIKNKIVFQVNSRDAQELSWEFNTTPPAAEVTGRKPILTLSHTPWGELLRNDHANPKIVKLMIRFRKLLEARTHLCDWAEDGYPFFLLELPPDYVRPKGHRYAYRFQVTRITLEECEKWLNPYLLACEQGRERGTWLTELVHQLTWGVWNLDLSRRRRDPYEEEMYAQQQEAQVAMHDLFEKTLEELGDLLAQEENHIKTESGQYESVYGSQRTHNDMAAEIANGLTNLPKFIARCKIFENEKPVEYMIKTNPVPQPDADAESRAAAIRERSQALYGRKVDDRHDILDKRKPADDESNRSLPRPDDPAQPKADDEDDKDDFFR